MARGVVALSAPSVQPRAARGVVVRLRGRERGAAVNCASRRPEEEARGVPRKMVRTLAVLVQHAARCGRGALPRSDNARPWERLKALKSRGSKARGGRRRRLSGGSREPALRTLLARARPRAPGAPQRRRVAAAAAASHRDRWE